MLGLVMASAAAPKVVPKAKAAVAPNGAAPKPFKGDGVLQIDGATLEGWEANSIEEPSSQRVGRDHV